MPVEFALRPRIRLREDPPPARRARLRLPKFALPALAYWLAIGGLVYEFVRDHDSRAVPAEADTALARLPSPSPPVREWWRPLPAKEAAPLSVPIGEPPAELGAVEAPPAEPTAAEPTAETPLTEPPPAEPAPEAPLSAEAPLAARAPQRSPRHASRTPTLASDPANTPALDPIPTLDPLSALSSVPAPAPAPAFPPVPAPSLPPVAGALPSCEAALASASQDVDFSGSNRAADLPTQAIAAVLENGAWLSSCAVPEHTALDVCVAIKGGGVIGASVTSRPTDVALNACVRRRASALRFPYSPHVDLARTRF